MEKRYTHMTFFWGTNSEVLFKMWPGTSRGMYGLALIVVFFMAFFVELLSCRRVTRLGRQQPRLLAALFQTAVHALRVGLAYLLMLALMSFNVGVLIVAIAGSAAGFLLFHSSVFHRVDTHAPGGDAIPVKQ